MTAAMRRIILLIAGLLVLSSAHVQVQSGDDARRPAGKQWPAVSYMTDEYAFSPFRARVKKGVQVTWRNNGLMVHTIVGDDGSWTTGALNPADVGGVIFDKPGSYTYRCKEHPWVVGQIVVTE